MITVWVLRSGSKPIRAEIVNGKYDYTDSRYENRNNWKTFAAAGEIAQLLGPQFIATDAGPYVSPRYDVQRLPAVGDEVSYGFNGDYYPCGKIVSVSAGPVFRRIVAEENGRKRIFWRRKLSGSWVMDQTWSLVAGHVSKRNPEF